MVGSVPKGIRAGHGKRLERSRGSYFSALAVGAGLFSDLVSDLVSGFDSGLLPVLAADPFLESGTEVLPLP